MCSVTLLLSALLLTQLFSIGRAQEELPVISGRILDHARHPVSGIMVRLFDDDGRVDVSATSGDDGNFEFEHKASGPLTLHVNPGPKTGLANALIEHIPGDQRRNFAIVLQRGFAVSGRVVNQGKGLKGIPVRVVPADTADLRHVHGGGFSKTARDGSFEMVLTPGPKKLEIVNFRYKQLVSHLDREFTVTSDMRLSDLVLPALR